MDPAADEEPNEFLEPVEDEIVQNVVDEPVNDEEILQVGHEEVLEEIVDGGEVMYDEEGRLIEYVYEDGTEVIEEFVEVEGDANGDYAFVVVDEHGERRLVKHSELEMKKTIPELMDDVDDGEGPSSSYTPQKQQVRHHQTGKAPATMRDLLKQGGIGRVMYGGYYSENRNKRIHNMAKVDVEKYVPAVPINRRPLPDNPDFGAAAKKARSRKNPPWQEDATPSRGPSTSRRSPSPVVMKDPLFTEDDELVVRFKCPECGDGFSGMANLCDHMVKIHECQSIVREVEFFNDRDFDSFFMKLEKSSVLRGDITGPVRKKSRAGTSQTFVCNYMKKERGKNVEFVEVGPSALADRPEEFCSAFVQKVHGYESIRVTYCDTHIHHEGSIGFRVPLTVKRRMFEMAFKRLPIPCMQLLLGLESETLLPNPTRFEQKLKNFSHVEIVELMDIINASLKKYPELESPIPKSKKVAIKFETFSMPNGRNTLVVRRFNPPRNEIKSSSSLTEQENDEPMEEDDEELVEGADGLYDENMLYDPMNNKDPLLDELTETELAILEAYERDIRMELNEEQKRERLRNRTKFALQKVVNLYNTLDTATHTIAPTEMHNDSINNLREMASFVVEIVCQLDAEVKAQFNPALGVDEIKRDMIAGIAMQERTCQPERRRRSGAAPPIDPSVMQKYPPRRGAEEYPEHVFEKVAPPPPHRSVESYELTTEERHIQMLRQIHMEQQEVVEQKTTIIPQTITQPEIPEELKGTAYTKPTRRRQPADPNAPSRKRTKKEKAKEVAPDAGQLQEEEHVPEATETVTVAASPARSQSPSPDPSAATETEKVKTEIVSPVKTNEKQPEPPEVEVPAAATKTRTGRVVKPKKWGDE